jgi:hypothetical protein
MATSLVGQIAQAAGLPSTVRVGMVESTAPLTVSVQGATYASDAVGIVQPGVPAAGQPVALLGQAGLSGGDPASWLVLGGVTAPAAVAVTVQAAETALASTASLAYVPTAVVVSAPFIAPTNGTVLIHWRGGILTSGAGECFISPEITDPDGGVFLPASDSRAVSTPLGSTIRVGSATFCPGLTPGLTYTVTLMQRTTNAGSPALAVDRQVIVAPTP